MNDELAIELHQRYGGIRPACRAEGVPFGSMHRALCRAKENGLYDYTVGEREDNDFKLTNTGETIILELKSDNPRMETVEDAIEMAGIDTDFWVQEKITVNGWDVTAKFTEPERFETKQNYQIKVVFKRKIPVYAEELFNSLIEKMKVHAPVYKRPAYLIRDDPHMAVLSLCDAHFGMLAWAKETGIDYDTAIASKLYIEAGKKLIAMTKEFPLEKIVLVVGNDLFHSNDPTGRTPKSKNVLDMDGRLAKIFDACTMSIVKLTDYLSRYAPVEIVWVPGNHDPETSWFASKFLEAWFNNNKYVTVNSEPTPRKYMHYGINLLGWTHGDEEKHRDLPAIMLSSNREALQTAKYFEWQLGHFHKKKEMWLTTGDEFSGGVRVRVIPSLTAKDAWHTKKGYMSLRSAELYLYSKTRGYTGHYAVNLFDDNTFAE